jgi:predicted secreted protein
MATLTGNNGVVKIDNSSGSPTTIAAVRNFSIDVTSDTIETTTMGNDTRQYVKGLSSFSGSADIYFDPDMMPTSTTGNVWMNPTTQTVGTSPYTFEGYLNGSSNKLSGEIIVTGFSITSSMDGMVEASLSFQGSGALSYAAS